MPRLSALVVIAAVAALVFGLHDLTRGLTAANLVAPASAAGAVAQDPDGAPDAGPAGAPGAEHEGGPEAGEEKADLTTDEIAVGTVVTTAGGATLYRSDRDTARPSKSNCTAECAAQWPPLWDTSGLPSVDGIDPRLLGTVTRADGNKQVTLAGWPLYRYAPDSPGEAGGDGVGGTWHAVGPDGNPAVREVEAPEPARAPAVRPAPVIRPAPKPTQEQQKRAQEQRRKQAERRKPPQSTRSGR